MHERPALRGGPLALVNDEMVSSASRQVYFKLNWTV